jgi:hypothetical protein
MKHVGENVVRIEAEALRALADRPSTALSLCSSTAAAAWS